MDHTKTTTFAAFKHTEDRNTYWINCGWRFDLETPGLFPYETKEQKQRVHEVAIGMFKDWEIKNIQLITLKVVGTQDVTMEEETGAKKRGRKPKDNNIT